MTGRVVGPVFGSKNKKDANNRPLDSYIRKQLDMLTKRMKTTGQKFGKGIKRLTDGTVIEFIVNLNGPTPLLLARVFPSSIGGISFTPTIYILEAGLLQAIYEGDGIFSSLLHIGEKVPLQYSSFPQLFPNGELTNILPIDYPVVGDINPATYTSTDSRVRPDASGLLAPWLLPASVFTGKLRLYIQSLYGAKRGDARVTLNLPSPWPSFSIGNFNPIPYRSRNSSFLVTTENWDYFLVTTNLSREEETLTLKFYRLVFCGEISGISELTARPYYDWALDELRTNYPSSQNIRGDENQTVNNITCLESIVLSLSTPETTVYQELVVDCSPESFPFGSPLAYGWHSNWSGSEAGIVLVTLDTAGFAFGSHEVKLSISHTYNEITDDTVFSSECTVTEGGSTKVLNDFCVWVPTGTYQTSGSTFLSSIYMCGIVDPPNAVIPYPAPEEISEIPLYGFFNVDNNWEVVSFSREYSPNTLSPITPLNDQVCHGSDDISISLFGSQQLTTWTISSTSQEKTLSAVSGGVSFISSDYYGVETGTEVFESAAGSTQLYSISAAECNSRFPGFTGFSSSTIYWFRYNYGVAVLTAENINDYVPIGRVALVVPHDDCDAILGLSQQVTGVGQTTITDGKAQFTNNLTGVLYAEIKAVNPDGSPGATLWSGIDRRYSRFTLISSAVTDAHDSVSYPGFEVLEQDVWLYAPVQREVASYAVGDQHNLPTNSILVRSGILPSVIPDLVTANDRDWEVFMYAPDGVCSMGNRDVFMTPAVMLSANYLSFLGRGQPSDMELITSDGFTNGNSFVGWA